MKGKDFCYKIACVSGFVCVLVSQQSLIHIFYCCYLCIFIWVFFGLDRNNCVIQNKYFFSVSGFN